MNKNNVQTSVILILLLSICPFVVSGQNKQIKAVQNTWQEIKWEKWGLNFSVPSDLKETSDTEYDNSGNEKAPFGAEKSFARFLSVRSKAPALKLSVDVTNWKGEKIKTEYQSGEVELLPEQLLEIDHIGDLGSLAREESLVVEVSYLEVDRVKGYFIIMNAKNAAKKTIKPENEIVMIWGTYRNYKGNVQKIAVAVEGKRKELETMKKIINSLKFN